MCIGVLSLRKLSEENIQCADLEKNQVFLIAFNLYDIMAFTIFTTVPTF